MIITIILIFVVGPSMDQSGINIVDCLRVYAKSKEDFGWPERPSTPGLSLGRLGGVVGKRREGEDEGTEKEVIQASETHHLSPVGK